MRIFALVCVVSMAGWSTAVAQTANFRCPAPGTIVEWSNGDITTWTGSAADHCTGNLRNADGTSFAFLWYAPMVGARTDRGTGWVDQVKPANRWPLALGKKTSARYSGANIQGSSQGVWDFTFTVDKYERVTTKAGTFDAFVTTQRQDAISHSYKSTERQWYAPEPGLAVKIEFSDNQGVKRNREVVAIRR